MKRIMFKDRYSLTEAVLSGRKTQTRYIVPKDAPTGIWEAPEAKARFKVGEIVAVAQSYADAGVDFIPCEDDEFGCHNFPTWQTEGLMNKMRTRADLMPHQIRITNVRMERLQDITDEDCIREGVELNTRQYEYNGAKFYCVRGLGHWRAIGCHDFNSPREAYAALIDRLNGKGTWKSNPYVIVYDFELVK